MFIYQASTDAQISHIIEQVTYLYSKHGGYSTLCVNEALCKQNENKNQLHGDNGKKQI